MDASTAIAQHKALINEVGETVYVRRFTGSGTPRPKVDTATKARVMNYTASQLVGPIVQGDRRVIALVDTLTDILPVTTSDKLVVRGKELSIKAVDDNTRRIGGTLIALEMTVSG